MKASIAKSVFLLILLSVITHFSFSQTRDSSRNKNQGNIPDTFRIAPHRMITEDTTSRKLEGGALIDTVTAKKNMKHRNDVDDRMDTLKKPHQ